jgi:hypothetical protein
MIDEVDKTAAHARPVCGQTPEANFARSQRRAIVGDASTHAE